MLKMPSPSLARRTKPSLAAGLVNVFAVNEREPLYRDISQHPVGTIVAANDDLLVEANFSEPLTAYATGWRDPSDLQGALDFVAPGGAGEPPVRVRAGDQRGGILLRGG